jgi:hypothetical protein
MKQQILGLGLFALCAFLSMSACGGSSSDASCDSSKCAPGNECISDGKDTKCRLLCPLKDDGSGGQATCPLNYHCVDGPKPYCTADATAYAKSSKGLWGAPCSPTGGFDSNPACDSDQSFWCYGVSPVDGGAFCTQYQCKTDADCRGGWWCATINTAPNVNRASRTVGDTQTACLPRSYCSPCASDIDCPLDKGRHQHCVSDSGGAKFCTPECNADTECNQEAKCLQNDDANAHVCFPNAGACVGDGSMCSPCRSDADCSTGGACVFSSYSTEHFCTVPSGNHCQLTAACKLQAQCPANPVKGNGTSCSYLASDNFCAQVMGASNQWPDIPNNFCFGLVTFGTGPDQAQVPGCYTARR